jgi:ketosteroid isomerase-like protein
MFTDRMMFAARVMVCCLASASGVYSARETPVRVPENEQALWKLERAYWRYVQDNNLTAYLRQWHKDFVGWPSVSAAPVHKDHITDWITSRTSKGLTFKPGEFKPAALQITDDVAVAYYWMSYKWEAKDGTGEAYTTRVTHTWIKNGEDWQIIGGMSALEPATSQK